MREMLILVLAAVLEVGGDALVRWGLTGGRTIGLILGGIVLVSYGFMVNLTKLDFGRLMGIYIVVFFLVSQVVAVYFFQEKIKLPLLVGGALIVAGGVVLTCWRGDAAL